MLVVWDPGRKRAQETRRGSNTRRLLLSDVHARRVIPGTVPAHPTHKRCSSKAHWTRRDAPGEGPGGIWRPPGPSWVAPSPSPWTYSWEQPSGTVSTPRSRSGGPAGGSPVAVEALQLPLNGAADAAAIGAVQPGAHHAQPVVPLLPVEGKVLHLGGDALATFGGGPRGSAGLLPGEDGSLSWVPSPPPSHEGGTRRDL